MHVIATECKKGHEPFHEIIGLLRPTYAAGVKDKAKLKVNSKEKTTKLKTYPRSVNSMLRTKETDETNADTGDRIITFIEPLNKTLLQYLEVLVTKTLRCGHVFEE